MQSFQPEGYLAEPRSGKGPGVLVLHPWWGLNDTIREVCDRLAGAGFVAFAPDLYHGKIAKTIAEAETLATALGSNSLQAQAEVAQAAENLNQRVGQDGRGLAVLGFSMGANYALDLAAAHPEHIRAVILFYGTGGGDFSASRAAYLGHFAGMDPYEPAEDVDGLEAALKSSGRPVTFFRYEGVGHWFFERDRQEAFDETAARLAWERTIDFLNETVSTHPAGPGAV